MFLYLLGKPMSDVANFTDKRLISSLIRESGNNCTVEIKLMYQVSNFNSFWHCNVEKLVIWSAQNKEGVIKPTHLTYLQNNR